MEINQIFEEIKKLNRSQIHQIKSFAEGLLTIKIIDSTKPIIGNEYNVGDDRNGKFKVKVLKNRSTKSLVIITENLSQGTRRKTFQIGETIVVPFSFFKS